MSGMLAPEVLVLGATGRVGRGVVAALLEAGSPVLAVARDAGRLAALVEHHADEPALQVLACDIDGDAGAGDLASSLAARPRVLRAVVDAMAPVRRAGRLLEQPSTALVETLQRELEPRLAAARQLLPRLRGTGTRRYVLVGGPGTRCGWAGYGHASVAGAATRMLAQVLHEEAQELGVRLQLLSVDALVWAEDNAGQACTGWHSALGVGRGVVSLLASKAADRRCVVDYSPVVGSAPPALLACDFESVLGSASGAPGAGQAA